MPVHPIKWLKMPISGHPALDADPPHLIPMPLSNSWIAKANNDWNVGSELLDLFNGKSADPERRR